MYNILMTTGRRTGTILVWIEVCSLPEARVLIGREKVYGERFYWGNRNFNRRWLIIEGASYPGKPFPEKPFQPIPYRKVLEAY